MADDEDDALDRFPVNRDPNPAEWIIGAASALGILALLIYLTFTALTETDGPPVFAAAVDEIIETGDGWHVRLTLSNTGDKTAADVVLHGEATGGESSETTFDYVPAGSSRSGAIVFAEEPSGLALSVRSYTDP